MYTLSRPPLLSPAYNGDNSWAIDISVDGGREHLA
jgi:hypothetical protein